MQFVAEYQEGVTIVKELGCLPLAIEQAGAYIWAQSLTLDEYLMEYRTNFQSVTENRPEGLEGYATVYTTWQISLEAIKATNVHAAQLLILYGFLSNDVSDELLLHGEKEQVGEAYDPKQLKKCIELLLSYSLVKRDGRKHRVWIHPVVHQWTHQHLTAPEKVQQTKNALNIVVSSISLNSKDQNVENKLAFSRGLLPDVEACVRNVMDHLQDRAEYNDGSWKCFMDLRDFLKAQGMYKLGVLLAMLLKSEQEKYIGQEDLNTFQSANALT